jgi:diacylglycerol kinase
MGMELKDKKEKNCEVKHKPRGIHRFINSFKYSFDGLKYAYTNEQSLTIHIIFSVIVLVTGLIFEITEMQWALVLFAMALIIVAELLNTAIEATVDMVTEEFHPLAKVAKDCASAAVFIASLVATGMWCYVFIPKIICLIF